MAGNDPKQTLAGTSRQLEKTIITDELANIRLTILVDRVPGHGIIQRY